MSKIFYKEESYQIIGICMDIHNHLGSGFLELLYKGVLEYEFSNAKIPFEREKEFEVIYKGVKLPYKFYADFVVFDNIILEVKAVSRITNEFVAQAMNYLKVSGNKLALVVNFGESKLNYKRVIL